MSWGPIGARSDARFNEIQGDAMLQASRIGDVPPSGHDEGGRTTGGLGIAVSSGMLRGVFCHGVVTAIEQAGIRADVYGGTSSAVLSVGLAAAGQAQEVGVDYWHTVAGLIATHDMSTAVLTSIDTYWPTVAPLLFHHDAPRLLVATSKVRTDEAAAVTQGPPQDAFRLGLQLIRDAARGKRRWADKHLTREIWDTYGDRDGHQALTADNGAEVIHASTRMLHALPQATAINGRPHIDGTYTCACPLSEVIATGPDIVLVISPETGPLYTDFFRREQLLHSIPDTTTVHVLQPPGDLRKLVGVDYAAADPDALEDGYRLGLEVGDTYLDRYGLLLPSSRQQPVAAAGSRP
jgi:hypothetical protein